MQKEYHFQLVFQFLNLSLVSLDKGSLGEYFVYYRLVLDSLSTSCKLQCTTQTSVKQIFYIYVNIAINEAGP